MKKKILALYTNIKIQQTHYKKRCDDKEIKLESS